MYVWVTTGMVKVTTWLTRWCLVHGLEVHKATRFFFFSAHFNLNMAEQKIIYWSILTCFCSGNDTIAEYSNSLVMISLNENDSKRNNKSNFGQGRCVCYHNQTAGVKTSLWLRFPPKSFASFSYRLNFVIYGGKKTIQTFRLRRAKS